MGRVRVLLLLLLFSACQTKENKQWNLNKTIGWGTEKPENWVLIIKWETNSHDSLKMKEKLKFDEEVLEILKSKKLGFQAENDSEEETDLHFVVSKNYEKAISEILDFAENYYNKQKITIYRREYKAETWVDIIVYPN